MLLAEGENILGRRRGMVFLQDHDSCHLLSIILIRKTDDSGFLNGFVVLQDPSERRVIYSESQDGNVIRVDRVTGETISIRPQPPAGEPPYRFQWDTPLAMSPHDPKVIYAPGNKVLRSADRVFCSGADLKAMAGNAGSP